MSEWKPFGFSRFFPRNERMARSRRVLAGSLRGFLHLRPVCLFDWLPVFSETCGGQPGREGLSFRQGRREPRVIIKTDVLNPQPEEPSFVYRQRKHVHLFAGYRHLAWRAGSLWTSAIRYHHEIRVQSLDDDPLDCGDRGWNGPGHDRGSEFWFGEIVDLVV